MSHFNANSPASRTHPVATFLLVLAAMFVVAAPAFADDCCPAASAEAIKTWNDHDVRALQLCLVDGGFYDGDNDHLEIDGIIGPRTLNAFAKAHKICPGSSEPSDEPSDEPAPKPQPYVPANCEDGDQFISYVLTKTDLDGLGKPPKKTDADPPDPPAPIFTPDFLKKLGPMQDAEYPSRDLFENALNYFSNSIGTPDQIRFVSQKACKVHAASDTAAGWIAKSDVPMIYDLAHASYGFYPYWLGGEAPADPKVARTDIVPIDFSILTRLEWLGVTFSDDGKLNLPASMHQPDSTVSRKTEIARSFDARVDLVVYRRESDWRGLILANGKSPGQLTRADFIDRLSGSIADEVGTPLTGFLDRLQNWFPSAFRSSPTYWDGVTLYFDGYPFNDHDAMQYLVDLLRVTRSKLRAREQWANLRRTAKQPLALNLVVPFCSIVSNASCPGSSADSNGVTVDYLKPLVPKTMGESNSTDDVIDAFIVFLPQPTSDNKKALRMSIESDFNRTADKASMQENESLAEWRQRMLGKISYVLFPATWAVKGAYQNAGMQFYDDVVYSTDAFQGIGLWPLPTYGSDNNKALARDIRSIFKVNGGDWAQSVVAPLVIGAFGRGFADFFLKDRRLLFLVVEVLFLLLIIYAICALWIVELRQFWNAHLLWCLSPVALIVAILGFQFLFDRELSSQFTPFLIVLFIAGVGGWLVRRTFLSDVEKDLP